MDDATRARVFEPFFTTKGSGTGTGMGLASVYGFVKQSGGHITVGSEVGRGTVVCIYLPQTSVVRRRSPPPAPRVSGSFARGAETILLVESDESVRSVARRILGLYGYAVLEATNAGDAESVLKANLGGVDVLLVALRLPQVSGVEVAQRARRCSPGLAIVIMSGAADSCAIEEATEALGSVFVQKPFVPDALISKIQESLLVVSQRLSDCPESNQGH
jgi:CheY-like chemotaxis protein